MAQFFFQQQTNNLEYSNKLLLGLGIFGAKIFFFSLIITSLLIDFFSFRVIIRRRLLLLHNYIVIVIWVKSNQFKHQYFQKTMSGKKRITNAML